MSVNYSNIAACFSSSSLSENTSRAQCALWINGATQYPLHIISNQARASILRLTMRHLCDVARCCNAPSCHAACMSSVLESYRGSSRSTSILRVRIHRCLIGRLEIGVSHFLVSLYFLQTTQYQSSSDKTDMSEDRRLACSYFDLLVAHSATVCLHSPPVYSV